MKGSRLCDRFNKLYALAENKIATVANMHFFRWGEDVEAWRWCRRLFAWEEAHVGGFVS